MRSKRFYLSVVAAILLLFVVGVVIAQEATDPSESVDPTKVKENAVRAILDNNGKVIDPSEVMAKAARDNEGGFGGWYFTEDKDTVHVFMTDTTKTAAAETAFNSSYSGQHSPSTVVAVSGTHSMDDLATWRDQMLRALLNAEITLRSFDIDPGENVINIRLAETTSLEDVESIRDDLGIPASAIQFSLIPKGELLGGDDLEDEWRPLVVGPVDIQSGYSHHSIGSQGS